MEDIYSQGELERNSIVAVPEGYARDAGNTLYSWLGSIWRDLNRGDDMVRGLQSARGIRLAQLYVDAMEAAMPASAENAAITRPNAELKAK